MDSFNKIPKQKPLGLFFGVSFFVLFGVVFGVFGFSNKAAALISTDKGFAGKIITTRTPIICSSQYGTIFIKPKGGTKNPGPFVIESTTKIVRAGTTILGNYEKQSDLKTCHIKTGPYRVPVPVYKIKKDVFNTSKR